MKRITIMLLGFMMLSGVFFASVKAAPWPNLPTTAVTLNVVPGTDTYFICTLSGIGTGYDVVNGAYPGWCIDALSTMTGSDHLVKLYSSLSNSLPAAVSSIDWNKINYILNNKQGNLPEGMDVQEAIWHFTDGISTSSSVAQAMIDAANANQNFVPDIGQIMAVILVKSPVDTSTQNTIIELVRTNGPGNGKVTGGGQCIVGTNTKIPSASFGFNAMWFSRDPTPKGELNYIDHITGMHVHIHELDYLEVSEYLEGNKPWPYKVAVFRGPCTIDGVEGYAEVYVEDHGEPGKNDRFQITLSTGYVGGSDAVQILAGNIQIHKPPK